MMLNNMEMSRFCTDRVFLLVGYQHSKLNIFVFWIFGKRLNEFLTFYKTKQLIDSLRKLSTDVPDLLRPEEKHPKTPNIKFLLLLLVCFYRKILLKGTKVLWISWVRCVWLASVYCDTSSVQQIDAWISMSQLISFGPSAGAEFSLDPLKHEVEILTVELWQFKPQTNHKSDLYGTKMNVWIEHREQKWAKVLDVVTERWTSCPDFLCQPDADGFLDNDRTSLSWIWLIVPSEAASLPPQQNGKKKIKREPKNAPKKKKKKKKNTARPNF